MWSVRRTPRDRGEKRKTPGSGAYCNLGLEGLTEARSVETGNLVEISLRRCLLTFAIGLVLEGLNLFVSLTE